MWQEKNDPYIQKTLALMKLESKFRLLVAAKIACYLPVTAFFIWREAWPSSLAKLSPQFAEYQIKSERLAVTMVYDRILPEEVWLATGVISFILIPVSLIGLLMFKKWAAWVHLVSVVVWHLHTSIHPQFEFGLEYSLLHISSMLTGAILFMAFFTDLFMPPEAKAAGIYEGKEDNETVKFGLLKDGVYELYENGESVEEGKWKVTNNKIHITTNDPEVGMVVNINQINADGSLTEIGEMIDGKQEGTPKEAQFTYKKIK